MQLKLRRFQPGDAVAVHKRFNGRRASEALMERRPTFSHKEAREWTRRAVDRSGEDRKFAVVVHGQIEPVGFTALYALFRQTPPELGILISGSSTAPGVGRMAEALTIAKAFNGYGAHRVYGRIPARNRAAKWVVESLGWQREAIMRGHLLREDHAPDDCEIWGVLPGEFRAATRDLDHLLGAEPHPRQLS